MKIDIIMENRTGFYHSQTRIISITHVLGSFMRAKDAGVDKKKKIRGKNELLQILFKICYCRLWVVRLVGGRESG